MSGKLWELLIKFDVAGQARLPRSYGPEPTVAALRGYPGAGVMECSHPNGVMTSELRLSWETGTTPLGFYLSQFLFPRVAAKRGNPGLWAITALRYQGPESKLIRAPLICR
jgi:hypothetical protein